MHKWKHTKILECKKSFCLTYHFHIDVNFAGTRNRRKQINYLPLSRPTPHTRIVWIGCVFSIVKFSGSINFKAPSSKSINKSLPYIWETWGGVRKKRKDKRNLFISFIFSFSQEMQFEIQILQHLHRPIAQLHLISRFCRETNPRYICWQPSMIVQALNLLRRSRPSLMNARRI